MNPSSGLKLTRSERGSLVADTGEKMSVEDWEAQLASRLQVGSPELAKNLIKQFVSASGLSRQSSLDEVNAALAILLELQPGDVLELQLMMQMLSASRQSLELLGEAQRAASPQVSDLYLSLSMRLMRLYAKQLEALSRYRRKAQIIRIEKVTMENSQAVFGVAQAGDR